MAKIQLNGKKVSIKPKATIYELLKKFKLNNKKVAIEHNGIIIPKSNYKKKYLPPEKFVNLLKKKFSPYCSVATWYLWRSIDPEPIQY